MRLYALKLLHNYGRAYFWDIGRRLSHSRSLSNLRCNFFAWRLAPLRFFLPMLTFTIFTIFLVWVMRTSFGFFLFLVMIMFLIVRVLVVLNLSHSDHAYFRAVRRFRSFRRFYFHNWGLKTYSFRYSDGGFRYFNGTFQTLNVKHRVSWSSSLYRLLLHSLLA